MHSRIGMTAAAILVATAAAAAQDNFNVKGEHREAIIANEQQRDGAYNGTYNYAPANRAGGFVYLSGVVAGAWEGDPLDAEGYSAAVERAFQNMEVTLAAAGASLRDVVKINTYSLFDSPLVTIDKREQLQIIAQIKNRYIGEPHPAWTAVGTTGLLPDRGLVEIEVIAHAPQLMHRAN